MAGRPAEGGLRRGHRRRRRPRPRRRLLPGEGARDHQRRGDRQGLARRRQHRPQHHDHPLELPLRRERPALRPRARPLGEPLPGAELQRHVLQARRADARAQRPRRAVLPAPRPLEPPERRRQRLADGEGGQALLPAARHQPERPLPGDGRRPAAPRRHRPPRRRRLGLRPRRRGARRRHHPELPGDRDPPRPRRPRHRRRDREGLHRREEGRGLRRRPHLGRDGDRRRPAAARVLPAAGAGLRADQADLPLRRHVELGARLPQPVRQGRARHRLRHRPVRQLLPARRPAADRAHAGGDLRDLPDLPPDADAAQMGRHRRRDPGPLGDPRQDAGPRPLRQLRLGHRRLQGDARAPPTSSPTPSPRTSRTRSTRPSRSSASPPAG